jgi:23S rRNA pseudouridine2457 synthase
MVADCWFPTGRPPCVVSAQVVQNPRLSSNLRTPAIARDRRAASAAAPRIVTLLNKPHGVLCQFSGDGSRPTLADFIAERDVYPAGRLDADSEGLLLLTDDGKLQHAISHPDRKQTKTYLVQVEGTPDARSLQKLRAPLDLGDFLTQGCEVKQVHEPEWLWQRDPPIRARANVPTSWLAITLAEGKNRQVRRMTGAVGLPTLRLVRIAIGAVSLQTHPLWPGEWREVLPAELGIRE